LWIVAVAIAIWGIVSILTGADVVGIVLVVAAALIGPAGRALHV
jgi:hypothetical protein